MRSKQRREKDSVKSVERRTMRALDKGEQAMGDERKGKRGTVCYYKDCELEWRVRNCGRDRDCKFPGDWYCAILPGNGNPTIASSPIQNML